MRNFASPTKKAVKRMAQSAFLSSACLLSACDPISCGSLLLDCIDDDGPVLSPRILPTPVLNYSYEAVITASIENEPYDDRFEYTFTLGAGLPEGLIVDTFQRQVRITGAPTELGDFAMRVEVGVEDPTSADRDRRLCRRSTAINYVFSVAETLEEEQETATE